MKFRNKPVVVEATPWFKDGDHPAVEMSVPWGDSDKEAEPIVRTPEGMYRAHVRPGDWILTFANGENDVCTPDLFAATYEPAEV